jgi:hypothetical protein
MTGKEYEFSNCDNELPRITCLEGLNRTTKPTVRIASILPSAKPPWF